MNDEGSAGSRLGDKAVNLRRQFLHAQGGIVGVMGIPHVADDNSGFVWLPGFEGPSHLPARRILGRDPMLKGQRELVGGSREHQSGEEDQQREVRPWREMFHVGTTSHCEAKLQPWFSRSQSGEGLSEM